MALFENQGTDDYLLTYYPKQIEIITKICYTNNVIIAYLYLRGHRNEKRKIT